MSDQADKGAESDPGGSVTYRGAEIPASPFPSGIIGMNTIQILLKT